MEFFIGHHIKVTGAGQAKDDDLFLSCFFAFDRFVHCHFDGVRAFGSGQNTLNASKILGGGKDLCLLNCACFHQALVIELGENRTHAVEAQAAGVRSSRNKTASKSVHLGKRTNATGVAVVVNVFSAREGRTAFGFNGNELIICFAAQLLTHKGSNKTA